MLRLNNEETNKCFPPAFTLIELIITIAVAGIAILALVTVFQEALKNMERQRGIQSANLMGEDLMNEIRSKQFVQSHTNAGANRVKYEYVDDYDGLTDAPPKTIEGVIMTNVINFTRRVVVVNVPATNFNSPPVANDTDFKRITVIVNNTALAISNMSVVGRYD